MFWGNLRQKRLEVNGGDLKRELGLKPGPLFTPLLKSLLDAKLDGKVYTKEDELALARALAPTLKSEQEKKKKG